MALVDTKFGDIFENVEGLRVHHDVEGETTYLAPDGRFVGLDGFVCPRSIEDFTERYPTYVTAYAYKLMHRRVNGVTYDMETFDDVASELYLHLRYLSPGRAGYKKGHRDYVEDFDPIRQHGAKKGQFFNYINLILGNRFSGYVYDKLLNDPVLNGFGLQWSPEDSDYSYEQESEQVITVTQRGENPEDQMISELDAQSILTKVLGVVKDKDRPQVERVLRAAMLYDKNTEIAAALDMDRGQVDRLIKKVRTACKGKVLV